MRGKGEPTVDMGGKEDALTRPRLRLYLVPRQPRSPVGNQAHGGQIFQILWPERGSDPVSLDPTRWQPGPRRRPPTHFLALHRHRRFLRVLQCRRLILHHCGGLRTGGAAAQRCCCGSLLSPFLLGPKASARTREPLSRGPNRKSGMPKKTKIRELPLGRGIGGRGALARSADAASASQNI